MAKVRTTVTLDEDVLKAVKVRAARRGLGDSEVIEQALRSHLHFGVLEKIWASVDASLPVLSEDEAMELALEAQHATRKSSR